MRCRSLVVVLLFAWLGGCDSTQYKNAGHPNFGDAEYKRDLADCRKQNSKIVMLTGYDDKSEVQTDEGKSQACMKNLGWQAVSR
jgi:hypothetical protein